MKTSGSHTTDTGRPGGSLVQRGEPPPNSELGTRNSELGSSTRNHERLKKSRRGPVAQIVALFWIASSPAFAQPFALESFTVDGGGGTSSGGTYSLSGTIGQPDAGTLSGGGFTLQGGFWAAVSEVVVPGTPELTVRLLSDGAVQICWPSSATGFELQDALGVSPAAWLPSTLMVADDGTTKCVTVPAPAGERFFRLAK